MCLRDRDIYRVGYAKDDKKDVPFATVELDKNVNFDEFHCLKIVVDGDKAFTLSLIHISVSAPSPSPDMQDRVLIVIR